MTVNKRARDHANSSLHPIKLPISEAKIQKAVRAMARQIDGEARRHGLHELAVVCIMDGAFIFCADLVRTMKTPANLSFLRARSYAGTRKGKTILERLSRPLAGNGVLVVDTIYDTGKTIAKVMRALGDLHGEVWLAVLVEKSGKAVEPARAVAARSFVGFTAPGDAFLVGYGLDRDGRFRDRRWIEDYAVIRGRKRDRA